MIEPLKQSDITGTTVFDDAPIRPTLDDTGRYAPTPIVTTPHATQCLSGAACHELRPQLACSHQIPLTHILRLSKDYA
jgi:hypothetical protein